MYKKILSAVTAITIVAGAGAYASNVPYSTVTMTASAEDYTNGTYESLTYQKYSDHIVISGCDESATEVNIPAEIEGLPITEIEAYAFYGCSSLSEITIPDSVTSIDWYAFSECSNLAEITIPNSVSEIGASAFRNTQWLENKREENPFVIVNGLLVDGATCEGEIVIPDNVTVICAEAFRGATNLTNVTINKNVNKIGFCAFAYCENLTDVTILNPECDVYGYDHYFDYSYSVFFLVYSCTLHGYEGSTTQIYAEKCGYTFESLGEYSENPQPETGDVDGDGKIDSSDATVVLVEYAILQTGGESTLTPEQFKAADTNKDGKIDSLDATKILAYYADISTGKTPSWD